MSESLQAIRGMLDILPPDSARWQNVEGIVRRLMQQYAYQEIRCPLLEKTALFKRSVGEVTDIVEKEMYTFDDRNGDSLSLRPEGTAQVVRAVLEHNLHYGATPRLWSIGPMFRHERPQKGRYRQFYQCSVEAFGMAGPDIDIEQILLSADFLKALGLLDSVQLKLNSLGTAETRAQYRTQLVTYFEKHLDLLDEQSKARLKSNPLRLLDSKDSAMAPLIADAPKLQDALDDESREHFEKLKAGLDTAGIAYIVDSQLVRGLDYYTKTVFEWTTNDLGSQSAICGGGRYDGLVNQLSGKHDCPAVGFSIGLDRIILLLEQKGQALPAPVDVYVLVVGAAAEAAAPAMVRKFRQSNDALNILMHCGGGSFKSQFKKADKSGARIALILSDDELENECVTVKYLRQSKDQQTIRHDDMTDYLRDLGSDNGRD